MVIQLVQSVLLALFLKTVTVFLVFFQVCPAGLKKTMQIFFFVCRMSNITVAKILNIIFQSFCKKME